MPYECPLESHDILMYMRWSRVSIRCERCMGGTRGTEVSGCVRLRSTFPKMTGDLTRRFSQQDCQPTIFIRTNVTVLASHLFVEPRKECFLYLSISLNHCVVPFQEAASESPDSTRARPPGHHPRYTASLALRSMTTFECGWEPLARP
jgi:hypothetical protein